MPLMYKHNGVWVDILAGGEKVLLANRAFTNGDVVEIPVGGITLAEFVVGRNENVIEDTIAVSVNPLGGRRFLGRYGLMAAVGNNIEFYPVEPGFMHVVVGV